jgi:hypothetical protein
VPQNEPQQLSFGILAQNPDPACDQMDSHTHSCISPTLPQQPTSAFSAVVLNSAPWNEPQQLGFGILAQNQEHPVRNQLDSCTCSYTSPTSPQQPPNTFPAIALNSVPQNQATTTWFWDFGPKPVTHLFYSLLYFMLLTDLYFYNCVLK